MNIKTKVGNRLLEARERNQKSQAEFAEVLGMSTAAYARLERGETYVDLSQLARIADTLAIPIQEFLPDTLSFHNNQHHGQGGVVFGDFVFNQYTNPNEQFFQQQSEIERLRLEKHHLENWVAHLKAQIQFYEQCLRPQSNAHIHIEGM